MIAWVGFLLAMGILLALEYLYFQVHDTHILECQRCLADPPARAQRRRLIQRLRISYEDIRWEGWIYRREYNRAAKKLREAGLA